MDFDWKWGVWIGNEGFGASPARSSVCCSPAGAVFVLLLQKTMCFLQKHDFVMIFCSLQLTSFAIKSMNHAWKWHPGPHRILMGTLNPWYGRPMTGFPGKVSISLGWLAAAEGLLLSEVPHARRSRRSADYFSDFGGPGEPLLAVSGQL